MDKNPAVHPMKKDRDGGAPEDGNVEKNGGKRASPWHQSSAKFQAVAPLAKKLITDVGNNFDILGESPFRAHMKATYPNTQHFFSFLLQVAFWVAMLLMFVHLCSKVVAKDPSVSREKLL